MVITKLDKPLVEQIKNSYVGTLNSLKADGSIQGFSIGHTQVSDEEVVFDISILPMHGVKYIKTNITVTKDGVNFDDEKK